MRCPNCKNKLLHKSGDATLLRTKGPLVFTEQGCKTRCYFCKSDITVPVEVKGGALEPAPEVFVMRK